MVGAVAEGLRAGARECVTVRDFGAWMASEQRSVFLLCRRMLRDEGEADSATQDIFLKAYRALNEDAGVEPEGLHRWLMRIAINTCLDRLRSRKWQIWRRRPAAQDEQFILAAEPDVAPDAEQRIFALQIQKHLEAAMGKLSERQRAVFALRHYEELALEEIAGVLKLDLGTVKAHLFRATSKLRQELKDLYGERTSVR